MDVRIRHLIVAVTFRRTYRKDGATAGTGGTPGAWEAQNVELAYDRLARVAYTELTVSFPVHIQEDGLLDNLVHLTINRLLDVYRLTTGEFHVETIPKDELWPMQVTVVGGGDRASREVRLREGFGYGLRLARVAPIPPQAIGLLQSGAELPIPRVLYLNALRELLRENFRLSVVEAEVAFEAQVIECVSAYYRALGEKDEAVESKLDAGLKNLLRDHIPKCCGSAFAETQAFATWESDLYRLRNQVVHRGGAVSRVQAEKAVAAARAALEWLWNTCQC